MAKMKELGSTRDETTQPKSALVTLKDACSQITEPVKQAAKQVLGQIHSTWAQENVSKIHNASPCNSILPS